MNRRTFLPWFTGGISTSFLVGAAGGIGVGSAGAAVGITASRPWTRESHSQQGEDLVLESICDFLKITNPSYLDVGAADPIQDNNTYLFYHKGCRGVLVEPNPSFCRRIEAARPGDRVLNIGVGVSDQDQADYYMIGGRDGMYLNSFSKKQVDDIVARSKGFRFVEKTIKMPLVNINKIMQEQFHGASEPALHRHRGTRPRHPEDPRLHPLPSRHPLRRDAQDRNHRVRDGDPGPDADEGLRRSRAARS